MPEFVTCPVCGCKVQVAESVLGRRVRCFGCDQRFVAAPESAHAPPPPERPSRPMPRPAAADDLPLRLRPVDDDSSGPEWPFCSGCGRRVTWQSRQCPHCGEEFDNGERGRRGPRFRRDAAPHRGALLATLGNVSLAAGALSLCLFGTGALVGIPLGVAVLFMAQSDLRQMRAGLMDAQGRQATETARASAGTGVILSLCIAGGYVALFLSTM